MVSDKHHYFFFLLTFLCFLNVYDASAQNLVEAYKPLKNDSLKVGERQKDYLPYIQAGYTFMLPSTKEVEGVLVLLEDSGFDQKNKSAKQLYDLAETHGFAVLSVSTELPFDFYFNDSSIRLAHQQIQDVFNKYQLPNRNIFFLGSGLAGHRALRYLYFIKTNKLDFQPNVKGLVVCNFTTDWTRKWYQYQREIRINRNDLWEAKFIKYMLENHLGGTPAEVPQSYHEFSAYSYFDENKRNIKYYQDLAVKAYVELALAYRYTNYLQTPYENSATDIIGFLAELELAGSTNTDLVVLPSPDDLSAIKNADTTWSAIDKAELMHWIVSQKTN